MTSYIFVFGRTPQLSFAELASIYPQAVLISDHLGLVESQNELLETDFLRLGGVTKVGIMVKNKGGADPENISQILDGSGGKIEFGLNVVDAPGLDQLELSKAVKKIFQTRSLPTRFIRSDSTGQIMAAYGNRKYFQEVLIFALQKEIGIAKIIFIQDIKSWSERDFRRPHSDAKSGMLPPKVSRMLVNITFGSNLKGKTLADPFCGMGTILSEFVVLGGTSLVGSDIRADIVAKARENISWISAKTAVRVNSVWHQCDAVSLSDQVSAQSIDAIITEPFMGSRHLGLGDLPLQKVKDIARGLDKLYVGCLRDWHRVLGPKGIICMAFPQYHYQNRKIVVKKAIDTCESLGYTKVLGPIEYYREQAVVRRNFYWFKKI